MESSIPRRIERTNAKHNPGIPVHNARKVKADNASIELNNNSSSSECNIGLNPGDQRGLARLPHSNDPTPETSQHYPIMRSSLPLATGILAILATTASIAFQVVLAGSVTRTTTVRIIAIVSAFIQLFVAVGLFLSCLSYSVEALRVFMKRQVSLFVNIFLSTVAAIVSVITIILLSNHTAEVVRMPKTTLLVACAVLIGTAYPVQLLFFVLHFLLGRKTESASGASIFNHVKGQNSNMKLKAIPYSHTNASIERRQAKISLDAPSLATSAGDGKSGVETSGSISSRTRLLSLKEKRGPASIESVANRSSTEETFESWDTSSVDAQNKQTILDLSSSPPAPSKPRFLETIPASPTGSRSPSPGSSIDLPLPPRRARRRSRSYSPASSLRESINSIPNANESHIHPLFRSDSTEPPPVATPGTSVVASPIAGQVISPRPSMRSLNRMRSGSLPTAPSPLSRQSSFEEGVAKRLQDEQRSIEEKDEEDDEGARKMTPPIPDWIMSAGSRSSLNGYKRRTLKDGESKAALSEEKA
ncbi:hypothetical protein LIA77_04451 [Sarocladium implicatum]|nr:hypothetical protein LIA77_04451 [Sarocladium implicatum]